MKEVVGKIHLSIDDVICSFRWIADNRPQSIFDLDLYGTLKRWNEQYGLKITLYCLSCLNDFLLSEIPDGYKDEFRNNSHWMRFGFHAKSDIPLREERGYKAGWQLVKDTIKKMGMGETDILRLHYWTATHEQKNFLKNMGVKTLLYPDSESFGYDSHDCFYDCGLLHRRTRVCYEKIDKIDKKSLCIGKEFIVAFTHEWCFREQIYKIEESIKLLKESGYEFV